MYYYFNFHPIEVLSRYRDPQSDENNTNLCNWKANVPSSILHQFISQKQVFIMKIIKTTIVMFSA